MRLTALALAALLVLAGCAEYAPGGGPGTVADTADPTASGTTSGTETTTVTDSTTGTSPTPTTAAAASERPDPESDRLGWEAGLWYDDPVSVRTEDGLNRSELDRVLARTMARVELIRDREFRETVDVEVISREQYRENNPYGFEEDQLEEGVFEALFVVGENGTVADAYGEIYGGSVQGYYAGGNIVIVTDDPGAATLDRATLAHELVHALQDQYDDLGFPRGRTTDARAAGLSVSEGDANYVMDRYEDRCAGNWTCLPSPNAPASTDPINRGLFLTVFFPYSDGPSLVKTLRERDGWTAVDELYDRPPESTEQVIHPGKYPDDSPTEVTVADRSNADWRRLDGPGSDTVGEMGVYAMFWANGVINESALFSDTTRYNYSHPASAGWDGDRVVPYRDGNGEARAYVWKTVWDTERDAREFRDAYRRLLESKDVVEVRPGVYRVPGGPYADAFRVTRDGRTVTIVNAPTVEDLAAVHGPT